jgi:hypothetical protein
MKKNRHSEEQIVRVLRALGHGDGVALDLDCGLAQIEPTRCGQSESFPSPPHGADEVSC